MPGCQLGRNKIKRFKKWNDWLRDAESKMRFLSITEGAQKVDFLRSCAGGELIEFWSKEVRIRFEDIPANQATGAAAQAKHTYNEVVRETTTALRKYVSRDRMLMELLRMEQGSKSFNEFLAEVEDYENLIGADERPLDSSDLKRISLLAGMKDRTLAEKALAEDYNLTRIIQAGINRESSKENVEAMQQKTSASTNRIASEEAEMQGGDLEARVNHLQAELADVMKLRSSGKYSTKFKQGGSKTKCPNCTFQHWEEGKCPAKGRTCNSCGKEGHYSKSQTCKKSKKVTARRVEQEQTEKEPTTESDSSDSEEEQTYRVQTHREKEWPGVKSKSRRTKQIHHITEVRQVSGRKKPGTRWVKVKVGGEDLDMYCNTGSKLSIIPPNLYKRRMGEVVAAKCHLRA